MGSFFLKIIPNSSLRESLAWLRRVVTTQSHHPRQLANIHLANNPKRRSAPRQFRRTTMTMMTIRELHTHTHTHPRHVIGKTTAQVKHTVFSSRIAVVATQNSHQRVLVPLYNHSTVKTISYKHPHDRTQRFMFTFSRAAAAEHTKFGVIPGEQNKARLPKSTPSGQSMMIVKWRAVGRGGLRTTAAQSLLRLFLFLSVSLARSRSLHEG